MFRLLTRAVSKRMTSCLLNASKEICEDSRALLCYRQLHLRLGELVSASSDAGATGSFPAGRCQFYCEVSAKKGAAVNAEQRLEQHEEGTRLDAVFFRTVLVASVLGACLSSWMSGSGMYGSPSSHAMLLKGPPYMRTAGLQRLRQCIEKGQHQRELEGHAISERLVSLLRTEADLDVWRELCSTLCTMLDSPGKAQELATWGVCAILSDRLAREDDNFDGAAQPLLQKLVALSIKSDSASLQVNSS